MSHGSLGYASLSGSSQSARLLRLQTATHALPCLRLPVGHSPNQASPPAGVRHMPGILASSRPLPQHGGYLWGIPLIRYVNLFTSARRRRQSATADHFPTFTARAATRFAGNPQAKAGLAAGGLYHPCSAGLPRHQSLTAADLG